MCVYVCVCVCVLTVLYLPASISVKRTSNIKECSRRHRDMAKRDSVLVCVCVCVCACVRGVVVRTGGVPIRFFTLNKCPVPPPLSLPPFRLTSALAAGGPEANMKKESKAYSFADQKWDAEMRAQLQRQRKASEGAELDEEKDIRALLKEAKLSQKQQVK